MRYTALLDANNIVVNTLSTASDNAMVPSDGQSIIDVTESDIQTGILGCQWDGNVFIKPDISSGLPTYTPVIVTLDLAIAARKAGIKSEAATLIAATDWKLQRATERETAGWATLHEVDTVLAERESIRQSSSAAELAVNALTTAEGVQAFTWAVDVAVPVPRRMTHTQFMDRFTEAELNAILAAIDTNQAMRQWWVRFEKAQVVMPDDPTTQAGVQALEIVGLIGSGRAASVLA